MPQRRIHCYAASFGHDLAKSLIQQYAGKSGVVVDPFSGSGTTLVEALSAGHRAIGIDVDPIACLISRIQTRKYSRTWLDNFHSEMLTKLAALESELQKSMPGQNRLKIGGRFDVNGYTAAIPSRAEIDYWFTP